MTRRFAVALAAAGLLVSVGCSKDETVTSTSSTTPVTASSGGDGSGTTEPEDDSTETTDPEDADKGGGSGEYAESCAAIEGLEALDDSDEAGGAATFELMEEARDAGPDELVDHWDTLIGVFEELEALGESDEALAQAFELFGDPEFIEAAGAIDDFASEECGIEIDLDPSGQSSGGLTDDTVDAPDPDGDATSITGVKAYLEGRFPDEPGVMALVDAPGWGATGGSRSKEWSITLSDDPEVVAIGVADLEAACEAMASYLDPYMDTTIEIKSSDDVVIVTRAAGEPCEAA